MIIIRIIKKFRIILSKHQKFRIAELLLMMIIGGFLEMLSVSLMIPFMQTVINPEEVLSIKYVRFVMNVFGIDSYRSFLVFLAIVMALVYLLKNAYFVIQLTIQSKFVLNNQFALQRNLFHSFMMRPYEYYLSAKSGDISQMVSSDPHYAFSVLMTLLSLASELTVSTILCITVFVIAPGITIVLSLLLLSVTMIIYISTRNLSYRAGERVRNSASAMYQALQQAILGIKEVKLMRKESFFEERYEKAGNENIRSGYVNEMMGALPRYMIEAVAMCGVFGMLSVMIYNGAEIEGLLPVLSAVAMAAVRLLPSANRITVALSSLSYTEPAVDKLLENLQYLHREEQLISNVRLESSSNKSKGVKIGNFSDSIELDSVSYKYPSGEKLILEKSELVIKKGQSVGIVGTSGAGKTTAVDIILGLLKPQNGKVLIDGTDIELDMDGWLDQIGYIPQNIFMLDGDVRENVAFGHGGNDIDDERVWEALREASLDEFVKSLPDGLNTQIGERGMRLSGGQKQRIGIARALYTNPGILFLDEATSALDSETEAAIMESIDRLHGNKTMIIIAHRLTTIENCDAVFRVEGGRIQRER